MRRNRLGRAGVLVPLLTIALVAGSGLARAQSSSEPEVVAEGLKNPRGLAWGSDGALYVAEAGKGGAGPCVESPEFGTICIGRTGAITRIWNGHQERVVRGLPSVADASGFAATGPHDVSVTSGGKIYIAEGLGAAPDLRAQFGEKGSALGRLLEATPDGDREAVVDIAGFEAAANPDGAAVDSNPYAVLARGGRQIVVDAGGNDLLEVDGNDVSVLAVFPDRLVDFQGDQVPMQAVPTSVVRGPDGAYYVGQLTGFPFPVGKARVYRVVPGSKPTIYRRGFTNIIDIAFGPDGSLYVLEIAHNSILADQPEGALIRVAPDGSRSIVLDGLAFPGGLAIKGHDIYLTNCGICPGDGTVMHIEQ
jgi:hypothetical protein